MQILGLLGVYFDAGVVEVEKYLLQTGAAQTVFKNLVGFLTTSMLFFKIWFISKN